MNKLPIAQDVFEFLEDFEIADQVSPAWVNARMTRFVIPWVQRKIRQSLNETKQISEYYSGTNSELLILNRRPVVSIDSIRVISGASIMYTITPNSIELIALEGIIKSRRLGENTSIITASFPKGTNNLKITYTYGFADVPDEIFEAILYLTAEQLLGHLANRTGGGTTIGTEGINKNFGNRGKYTDYRNDLTRQAFAMLKPYMTSMVGN